MTKELGLVQWQTFSYNQPFLLEEGAVLPSFELRYETYGELNSDKSNAILICHALTSDHHAAGFYEGDKRPGWWDVCIGPNKAIDTEKFFVVCVNNLGGCSGSTGPTSLHPETGEKWGPAFPQVRVGDWVKSQALLSDYLDIDCWFAVMGGSLGGMQALDWSIRFPNRLLNAGVIASAPSLTPLNTAFNEIAREAILSDDHYFDGLYYKHDQIPVKGVSIARMIGHMTYLSMEAINSKFDPRRPDLPEHADPQFPIISYLHHQGGNFAEKFDANTYLLFTKVLDHFNLATLYDQDLTQALSHATCNFLVVSFSSDWRFSPSRSQEISNALLAAEKNVTYLNIQSDKGHDAFLIKDQRYLDAISLWLNHAYAQLGSSTT